MLRSDLLCRLLVCIVAFLILPAETSVERDCEAGAEGELCSWRESDISDRSSPQKILVSQRGNPSDISGFIQSRATVSSVGDDIPTASAQHRNHSNSSNHVPVAPTAQAFTAAESVPYTSVAVLLPLAVIVLWVIITGLADDPETPSEKIETSSEKLITRAILFAASAAVLFSVMSTAGKLAEVYFQTSYVLVAAARGWVGWLLAICHLYYRGAPRVSYLGGVAPTVVFLRGASGALAIIFFWAAMQKLPLGDGTVLFMTFPFWSLGFATFIDGVWPGARDVLSALICLAGVVLITQPEIIVGDYDKARDVTLLPALMMVCASGFRALSFRLVQQLTGVDYPTVLHGFFALTALSTTVALIISGTWHSARFDNALVWMLLAVCGAAGYGAQLALTHAITLSTAAHVSVPQNLEVVLNYTADVLLFGMHLTPPVVVGALMITSAVLIIKTEADAYIYAFYQRAFSDGDTKADKAVPWSSEASDAAPAG